MSVKIYVKDSDDSIPVRDLRSGLLAKIVEWVSDCNYLGRLVQVAQTTSGLILVDIGKSYAWDEVPQDDHNRVCILPDKTLIEVNQ